MELPLNESKFIEGEVTFRNLRFSGEAGETRRSMVRWLALSLGVINPGESRQTAVSVLDAMLYFQFTERKDPTVEELSGYIGKNWSPINEKTLRYHLGRMKKMGLVDNSQGRFSLKPPNVGDRYDAENWASGLYDKDYKEIATKIGEAVRELRSKSSMGAGA